MLAGHEDGDHEVGDLLLGHLAAVLVLGLEEGLDDVGVVLVAGGDTLANDLHEEGAHVDVGGIPPPVAGEGQVGEEEVEGGEALVEVVVEVGDTLVELLAHLVAEEGAAGGHDDHLGEGLEEIHNTLITPAPEVGEKKKIIGGCDD